MKIRKARIHRFGGPEVLKSDEVEQSMPDALQVLIGGRKGWFGWQDRAQTGLV
jgi:hypothetical protein